MKHLVLLIVLIGLVITDCYTQNLSVVASNKVAHNLVVHTVKISNSGLNVHADTSPAPTENTAEIDQLLQTFSNFEGVSRATFDKATSTLTILSNLEFEIATALIGLKGASNTESND